MNSNPKTLKRSNALNLNGENNNYGNSMQKMFTKKPNLRRSNAVNLNAENNNYGNNMQSLFNLQKQNAIIAQQNAEVANRLAENANQLINGTQAAGPYNYKKNYSHINIKKKNNILIKGVKK